MKIHKKLLILVFLALVFFTAKNVLAVNCSQIGSTTFCDNGTHYNQIGNTIFGSDGSHYNQIGNTTFGSDGTYYNQIGNTTFGSNGIRYNQIGNTIFGSNGSYYNQIGNTTFGSSGGGAILNSCPANSSYDYLSSKCKCKSGYKSNGTSCVYDYSYSKTPTCPLNSYYDGVSSCKCYYGYVASGSSCVYQTANYSLSKTPIKTNSQICQESFGLNVSWDGTKASNGGLNCNCKIGYTWNSTKTACNINTNPLPSGCSSTYGYSATTGVLCSSN